MALFANIFSFLAAEAALLFTTQLSPDIGPGDIYQTIDFIHGASVLVAILLLLSQMYVLYRVPRPRKTQLMALISSLGLVAAPICFWALTQTVPGAHSPVL